MCCCASGGGGEFGPFEWRSGDFKLISLALGAMGGHGYEKAAKSDSSRPQMLPFDHGVVETAQ